MARQKQSQTEVGKEPRARRRRAPDFPFDFNHWLTNPFIRALTSDQRGSFMDAICTSLNSRRPGFIREDDLRVWMRYTGDEWVGVRDSFMRLFKVTKRGLWVLEMVRVPYNAQQRRLQVSRRAAKTAAQNRWRRSVLHAGASESRGQTHAPGDASLLGTQRRISTVPKTELSTGTGPPATSVSDAAAVAGLVQGVVARMVPGRSGP